MSRGDGDAGELRQNEQFLKKAYNRALIPCMASILSGNINILADGILVGQRIGTGGLAAINLCVPVYLVLCIAGSFLVSGTAIQASKAMGDNRMEQAQSLYQTSISSCLIMSAFLTAAGLIFLKPLTGFLCSDPEVGKMVSDYVGITLAGALPKIMIYVPFWFLRLDGRASVVTVMMTVMAVGNVALDVIFLYFFNMGVFGAGLASVIATAAACIIGFIKLCDKKSSFHFGISLNRTKEVWKEIAGAGSPSAMNNLFQTLRLLAVNGMLLKYGGSEMVACFTAVNCVSAFAGCVIEGVPQAASAMLGACYGEHDNSSIRLLIRREWKSGLWYAAAFSGLIILGADGLSALYGLQTSLRVPMICLAAGMFPALWCGILSGCYNVSDKASWSNAIILSRVLLTAAGSLYLLLRLGGNPWLFLFFPEAVTAAMWYAASAVYSKKHPAESRYLLLNCSLEREGRVLDFSVESTAENICDASSRITDFCRDNGMIPKQVIRVSLAMEEIMTLITTVNQNRPVAFDVRVFSLQGVIGIRIRYDGADFNPFAVGSPESGDPEEGEPLYMGIRMIESLVEEVMYRKIFGMNTLQILI